MPPDSPSEQELMLKKRARRRLVGAIALVLLMITVLPQVLQDRAISAQQDQIKITMPEPVNTQQPQVVASDVSEASVNVPDTESAVESQPEPLEVEQAKAVEAPKPAINEAADSSLNAAVKSTDIEKKAITKPVPVATEPKSKELFTVQVGVYSDAANVKRLQNQLKQAGFASKTERINTAKGESIRLKTGSYSSKQDAMTALAKIKAIGMPGIVVSQE